MTNQKGSDKSGANSDNVKPAGKTLSPAAERALAEAAERRARQQAEAELRDKPPKEVDGVDGPEPVRYGDWETKGRASDF